MEGGSCKSVSGGDQIVSQKKKTEANHDLGK